MAKIDVFKNNQYFMTPLGLYSYRLTEQTNEFYTSIAPYYILFFILTFFTISGIVFTFQNISQPNLVLPNITLVVGTLQCVGMYINIGVNMKKIKVLHLKLQGIVDTGVV